MRYDMIKQTVSVGVLTAAMAIVCQSAFAGNNGKGHNHQSNSHHNNSSNQLHNHVNHANHVLSHNSKFPTTKPHFPTIDPGIGNGKFGSHDSSDHHHGQHHDHHHGNQHWPKYVHYGTPAYYTYRTYSYPQRASAIVPIPTPSMRLVNGIDLKLVDVRLVDIGDATRNLGPRYRVTIANGGNQSADTFQVTAIASKDEKIDADLPNTTVDVAGITAGKRMDIDVRLPIEATTMIDGNPFNVLTIAIDSSEMVDEATEENNAGMLERTKIIPVNGVSR